MPGFVFLGRPRLTTHTAHTVFGLVWLVVVVGLWVCLLFENCTVDASIFVVKLSRADGGCLGTRSR